MYSTIIISFSDLLVPSEHHTFNFIYIFIMIIMIDLDYRISITFKF